MVYYITMESKIDKAGAYAGSGREEPSGELTLQLSADIETIKRVSSAISIALEGK